MTTYIWAFLLACGSLGIAVGIMISYWPWRPVVYPMGHPVYFLRGLPLRGYYRRDETIRVTLFTSSSATALVAIAILVASFIKIVVR